MFHGAALSTAKVDSAFFFILAVSVFFFILVMAAMISFLVKYRKTRHPEPKDIKESLALEIVWTVVPLVLVLLMFYFGWINFEFIRNPPKGAMEVEVIARQWSWLFRYADGKEDDVLRVPAGKPVKLVMTSMDVIHSFFVPAFRIKEDCVPGMKTHLWFNATEPGAYEIFCTEYCGQGHSHMRSQVIVMPEAEFEAWYNRKAEAGAAPAGLDLLKRAGCLGCHTTDGTKGIGPTFKGLIGSRQTVVTAGRKRSITVDAAYVKFTVRNPNTDIVPGYEPVMPKLPVTDDDLGKIIAFLESLK